MVLLDWFRDGPDDAERQRREILRTIRDADRPFVSTPEVHERADLDCIQQTTGDRMDTLVEQGRLKSGPLNPETEDGATVYWLPQASFDTFYPTKLRVAADYGSLLLNTSIGDLIFSMGRAYGYFIMFALLISLLQISAVTYGVFPQIATARPVTLVAKLCVLGALLVLLVNIIKIVAGRERLD